MKKIFLLFFLIGLFFPFVSLASKSYSVFDNTTGNTYYLQYEGLVPCGKCVEEVSPGPKMPARVFVHITTQADCEAISYHWVAGQCRPCAATHRKIDCTPCHLFAMVDGIIDLILLKIVPPVATILFLVGGISFYLAAGNPEHLSKAKSIMLSAVIGLVIIYTSWIIINKTLEATGVADWVGFGQGWYQIQCQIEIDT